MPFRSGRHFLQLPGPTNVPDRVLAAMARPTIDHRGPAFRDLTAALLDDLKTLFETDGHVFVFPGSGSGGWEAAIANTMSPGERVLIFEQGFFASKWKGVCESFGLAVTAVPWNARRGVTPDALGEALASEDAHDTRAVLVVHNETSTGVTTDLRGLRDVLDATGREILLMVDAVSSLAATELSLDAWGVDVAVSGSQKGLMLPPGLSFNAVGHRALDRHRTATLPRSYWDWSEARRFNEDGFFPYTPATNLLFGLVEALRMLREEGLERVVRRHRRLAEATRRAVDAWGLEIVAELEEERSNAVTAILMPDGQDADALLRTILSRFDMSLGTGLGDLRGRAFRIGHLGDLNALTLVGTLGGVEMGLEVAGVPHRPGGTRAAMDYLMEEDT